MRISIKHCASLLAAIACFTLATGQSLYVPRNFKQALKKETRTLKDTCNLFLQTVPCIWFH